MQESLTRTLRFQLAITEGSPRFLTDGMLESRRVVNEVFRLDKQGWNWDDIKSVVVDRSTHVVNTTQLLIDKAITALQQYYDYEAHGRPRHKHEPFPLRMNYQEGYDLSLDEETGNIHFRITTEKHTYVRGILQGSPDHLDQLQTTLKNKDNLWNIGTAEVVSINENHELHVTVTKKNSEIQSKEESNTVLGVDINEDCIALAALSEDCIIDSLVIDYSNIKEKRHYYFTIRKRIQSTGQEIIENTVQDRERRYVHDQLHKISYYITEWSNQFDAPILVFEQLTHMRDDIGYGARMNRRLHSLPFAKIREFITYKAAQKGIPSDSVDPAYTSQECPRTACEHRSTANRQMKRFKCVMCGCQDHSDRCAGISIAKKWMYSSDRDVPALDTLPMVRKVRLQESGRVDRPTVTCSTIQGNQTEVETGVLQ